MGKVWRTLAGMSRGLVIRWEAANEAGALLQQKGWLEGEAAWQYLGMGGAPEHSTLSVLLVGPWQVPVGKQSQIPQDRSFLVWQLTCTWGLALHSCIFNGNVTLRQQQSPPSEGGWSEEEKCSQKAGKGKNEKVLLMEMLNATVCQSPEVLQLRNDIR